MADEEDVCLGICYSENQLFYSVNSPGSPSTVQHIGAFDFNFDVQQAIVSGEGESFSGIKNSINDLKDRFSCRSVRILSPATEECRTILPRSVYDDTAEREAHIRTLIPYLEREKIEATWFSLSNVDQRLLLIRNSATMQGFHQLLGNIQHTEYVSDFELGSEWQHHTSINGSFLTIHCGRSFISVASFLLGKLRGTTIIHFEQKEDLPYFWMLFSTRLSWMSGFHEQFYFYGYNASECRELLAPYWDDTGDHLIMNTLEKMKITASEKTYGFRLERAFPAILLSLNYEKDLTGVENENHNRNS